MSLSLNDLLVMYQLNRPNLSESACDQYRISIRQFGRHLGREPRVKDLTSEAVGGFMIAMKQAGKSSGRTINNKRAALLTLSRFAIAEGLLSKPISTGRMREEQSIPNAFSVDELTRILKAASESPPLPIHPCHWHTHYWFPEHWEILIRLCYETGHRLRALLDCLRAAVDNKGVLTMPAKLTKQKRETRHQLSAHLHGLIEAQRPATDLLLPWPMSRKHIWEMLDRYILKPAGIPCDRRHKFHCLRRTSASHLMKACNDMRVTSMHLGHNDTKVTERYIDPRIAYTHVAACEILPRI